MVLWMPTPPPLGGGGGGRVGKGVLTYLVLWDHFISLCGNSLVAKDAKESGTDRV